MHNPEKSQMRPGIVLAVLLLSLSAIAQTRVSTQHVNLPLFIPCVNHGRGELVTLSGSVRVLTSRYLIGGLEYGFSIYAGIFTGKGDSTGHTYQAEGSNEATYKNVVLHPNGRTGAFTFTSNLHLRDLSYADNGIIYRNVREIIASNDGNTLTEVPEITNCN
jgi:hypothetical protein